MTLLMLVPVSQMSRVQFQSTSLLLVHKYYGMHVFWHGTSKIAQMVRVQSNIHQNQMLVPDREMDKKSQKIVETRYSSKFISIY